MTQDDATLESVLSRLDEYNSRTIFVAHLPRVCTLKQLRALFKKSVNARFSSGQPTGSSKFGFVEFKSSCEAKRAKAASESLAMAGKPVRVTICSERIAQKGSAGNKGWCPPQSRTLSDFNLTTLHVSCLPKQTILADLSPLFPKAQKIDLTSEGPNKCLGHAVVTFANPEDALEAFNSTHGVSVHKCPIIVNFKLRTSKNKKNKAAPSSVKREEAVPAPAMNDTASEMPKPTEVEATPKSGKKQNKKHTPKTGTPSEVSAPTASGKKATRASSKPVSAGSTPSTFPKLKKPALVTDTPATEKRKRPLPLSSPTDTLPAKAARKSIQPGDISSSFPTPLKLSGSAKKKRRASAVTPQKVAAI